MTHFYYVVLYRGEINQFFNNGWSSCYPTTQKNIIIISQSGNKHIKQWILADRIETPIKYFHWV